MNITTFQQKKSNREKISMITCYDYTSAKIISETNVDCILVGDSIAMTIYGFNDTLSATMDMMWAHTAAVSRGANNKFIISDLPFLSYRKNIDNSIDNVLRLMQSGAHAVKLEGTVGNLELITHLVESGVPVMGHIGLTPQFVHMLGGYKVQGRSQESAQVLVKQAQQLQEAGCFAIVLECMPSAVAKEISENL
jgi:3-methyl-2-oxobutanoate hydroxymethyltransferase